MTRKSTKHVKRRMVFLGPLFIFIVMFAAYTLISSIYSINSLSKEKITLENKLKSLQNEQLILEDEVERLKDPEYIAKYAREHYYYTKEGEYVIKYDEPEEEVVETKNYDFEEYMPYGIVIGSSLILLFIVFKIKK